MRREDEATMTPGDAHRLLVSVWSGMEELNWFVGAPPPDFPQWTAGEVGDHFTFVPPDGAPGLSFPKEELILLIDRVGDRLFGRMYTPQPPRRILRSRLLETHRDAFDALLDREPWRSAEDVALMFLSSMSRRAAADAGLAAEVEKLSEDLGRLEFLRVAEWVCGNYNDAWLCARFRQSLARGDLGWRRKFDLQRYAKAVALLTDPEAPFPADWKATVKAGIGRLHEERTREEALNARYVRKQAERQRIIEERIGGPILGATLGRVKKRDNLTWPYFSREILNLVSHFVARDPGQTQAEVCERAGRTLLALTDWFQGDDRAEMVQRPAALASRVRKRYQELRSRGEEPRPIPPLPKGPVWQNVQARIIPE